MAPPAPSYHRKEYNKRASVGASAERLLQRLGFLELFGVEPHRGGDGGVPLTSGSDWRKSELVRVAQDLFHCSKFLINLVLKTVQASTERFEAL